MSEVSCKTGLRVFSMLQYSDRRSSSEASHSFLISRFSVSLLEKRKPLSPKAKDTAGLDATFYWTEFRSTQEFPLSMTVKWFRHLKSQKHTIGFKPLEKLNIEKRGWTLDVLNVVRSLKKNEFVTFRSLRPLGPTSGTSSAKPPHQRQIRQQLQVLRDMDLLEFLGDGSYRCFEYLRIIPRMADSPLPLELTLPPAPGQPGPLHVLALHHDFCSRSGTQLRFYVDQLGFRVVADQRFRMGRRWIEVAPPDGNANLSWPRRRPAPTNTISSGRTPASTSSLRTSKPSTTNGAAARALSFPAAQAAMGRHLHAVEDVDGNSFGLPASMN